MRTAPNNLIYNLWLAGGPFIGAAGAPHGRVTVQPGWALQHSAASTFGSYDRGPLRWFQDTANDQTEREIPNIKTIDIDRSIDTDAATLKFVILNQKMLPNGEVLAGTAGEVVGQPGIYWPGYGDSAISQTRWGQTTNAYNDLLQPNALIRVYQGYGGRDKTIAQALADGNLIQTGLFLVDAINQDARTGNFSVSGRDMAKLLIEQTLYPPLVPVGKNQSAHYPLFYSRWIYENHPVIPYGDTVYRTGFTDNELALGTTTASTSDAAHPPAHAKDGQDPSTYWLSGGRLTGNGGADYEYLQCIVSGAPTLGGLNIQPYGGNYVMYTSVMVGGVWQGTSTIPYSGPSGGIAIKYVNRSGIGWERAATIDFGQDYANVEKVRVTFAHLSKVAPGPMYYGAGIRDLQVGTFTNSVSGNGRGIKAIQRGHNDSPNGYWLAGTDGGVFTFGNLKFYGSQAGKPLAQQITGMAAHPGTGGGYRLCGADGGVFDFGDCYYFGSLPGQGITLSPFIASNGRIDFAQGTSIVDIANGDSGVNGYYLLRNDGAIYSFGSAVYHGNYTMVGPLALDNYCVGMASVPGGYWILNSNGNVQSFGSAVDHGSITPPPGQLASSIEATSTGNGYWIVCTDGTVRIRGDATLPPGAGGAISGLGGQITDICRTHTNGGYWLCGEDGGVFAFGNAQWSGSLPEQYSRVGDGNYTDYVDIVKDLLLWSGWWFRNPSLGESTPADVFGNLESTGIYSPDNLTEDFFDKKPVIDVVNTLKEIVGYVSYADEIGSWQFKTPNVWSIGNFLETGVPTARMPVIDEKKQIIEYQVNVNDTDARSKIIIATDDPALGLSDTKSVTITSQWGPDMLRGIVRPALWVNGQFLTTEIQTTMAKLIDLHLFMQQRQGSLTMPANPILQIDDQVRVYERSSSDVYIHYVRGYTTHMDLESGDYTQTLQLHWMGDGTAFFLTYGT